MGSRFIPAEWPGERLRGVVADEILRAPRIDWDAVDGRTIKYIVENLRGSPWVSHLTLLAGILVSYAGLDIATMRTQVLHIQPRLRDIFNAYGLRSFEEWKAEEHVRRYLADERFPDSLQTRQRFLSVYSSGALHTQAYLRSLPSDERELYSQWAFPPFPGDLHRQLGRRAEVDRAQKQRRKEESDVITPKFAEIRGEAHLRWNELYRLRSKYLEAVALVESGRETLPLAFSYEEKRRGQRLHFTLWDKPTFALARLDQYGEQSVSAVTARTGPYAPHKNYHFVEFLRAESLEPGRVAAENDLLWFGDLLRHDLLGTNARWGDSDEVKRKQEYLRSWGYGPEDGTGRSAPFSTSTAELLAWPKVHATFVHQAQDRTEGLLVPVEPLFAGATLGLAALDIFTTTGARMNELMQVSLSPECLHTITVEGSRRLVLRLVPKGSYEPQDYFVGPETQRNLEKVVRLLREHYGLGAGEAIPTLPYTRTNDRCHRFPSHPYVFQYNGRHLPEMAITACIRFLCHGMVFQRPDGRAVALKAHTLRHAFATHAHHVERVPIDVVATMLHQKNVRVTGYYAAPTAQQVLSAADSLLDRFATHLGSLEEGVVRSPDEIGRQLDEARQSVGTLAKVIGGHCTCHAVCPVSFACTGCAYKVPDPTRRQEVLQQKQWALVRLSQAEAENLGPEATKMKSLIQRCDLELEEMRLIEEFREDEKRAADISVKPTR